jgi:hypothetical protein
VDELKAQFPNDLLVVTRHWPRPSQPASFPAALAAEAAARQGMYDAYSDRLYDQQSEWRLLTEQEATAKFIEYATDLSLDVDQFESDMQDPAIEARVQRDLDAGNALGITGTPTFYVNGVQTANPGSAADFTPIIEAARDAVDNAFSLNRQTGEIRVRDSLQLDFETNRSFLLQVRASNASTEVIDVTIDLYPGPRQLVQ